MSCDVGEVMERLENELYSEFSEELVKRARQKIRDQEGTDTDKPSPSTAFKIRQHYDKCRKRVDEALPTSPTKRKELRAEFAQKEGLKFSKPMKCVPRKQLAEDVKTSIL